MTLVKELSEAGRELYAQFTAAKGELVRAEARVDSLKQALIAHLDVHTATGAVAVADEVTVNDELVFTYHVVHRTQIDSARLRKAWPDVYEQYSKTTSYRRLVIA